MAGTGIGGGRSLLRGRIGPGEERIAGWNGQASEMSTASPQFNVLA